jgi:hypothetical protein
VALLGGGVSMVVFCLGVMWCWCVVVTMWCVVVVVWLWCGGGEVEL